MVAVSFGGRLWLIDARDMNHGPISEGSATCFGTFFDLSSGASGGRCSRWVFGLGFLRSVYLVLSLKPRSIGFAELSAAAGGSSGECYFCWEVCIL